MTMDKEQKIAEIREGYKSERDDNFTYKKEIVEQDIRFLLSELDREREENYKLREEREKWEKEARLQYRLFNEYHDESREKIEQLRAERDKLIEGLRWYADEENQKLDEGTRQWENVYSPYEMDGGQRARNILKEIGVTVGEL